MTDKMTLIRECLAHDLERARATIADFKLKFDDNPEFAMNWSDSLVEAIGVMHVYPRVLNQLDTADPTIVRIFVMREALMAAKSGSSSTSPMANFLKLKIAAAWAEAAMLVNGL